MEHKKPINKITFGQHARMITVQLIVAIGFMLVGAVLAMAFVCTEDEFWSAVYQFWGWK